jgi:hypothetical protein
MLKLTTLMFASALLLASGCAEHAQSVALHQSCEKGDQDACQQIAQDGAALYPEPPNVRVFPTGSPALNGGPIAPMGGVGGIGGIGHIR